MTRSNYSETPHKALIANKHMSPSASLGNCETRTQRRRSGAEQRPQQTQIANLLQLPDSIAELARTRLAEDRSHKIIGFLIDFCSRHWVLRRPPDSPGVMSEVALVP